MKKPMKRPTEKQIMDAAIFMHNLAGAMDDHKLKASCWMVSAGLAWAIGIDTQFTDLLVDLAAVAETSGGFADEKTGKKIDLARFMADVTRRK